MYLHTYIRTYRGKRIAVLIVSNDTIDSTMGSYLNWHVNAVVRIIIMYVCGTEQLSHIPQACVYPQVGTYVCHSSHTITAIVCDVIGMPTLPTFVTLRDSLQKQKKS